MKKNQWRRPYKIKRKKPIFKNRVFQICVLIIIFLGGIFYLAAFLPYFQVKNVKVSGNQKVLAQDLINAAESGLVRPVFFLESRSIILANSGKINRIITDNFPLIEKAVIKKDLPDCLMIFVQERVPVAVIVLGDNYNYIDREGVVFEKISEPDSEKIKITNQMSSFEIKLGEKVLDKNLLSEILKIQKWLNKESQVISDKAVLVSEQRLDIKTAEGWSVYFNLKGDIDWQLTELKTILEVKFTPEKRKNLQYIDLRFDKVFVFPQTEL